MVRDATFHNASLFQLIRPHFRIHDVRFISGILVVLFLKSMAALGNPVYRRGEPIKWGLVSYAVVVFLVVTVENAIDNPHPVHFQHR